MAILMVYGHEIAAGYIEFVTYNDGSGAPETMEEIEAYATASVSKMALSV